MRAPSLALAGVAAPLALCAGAARADFVAVRWFEGIIYRVDQSTGAAVELDRLGDGWRANAMARSADGRYLVTARLNGSDEWVLEIDPFTGASTVLFQTGLDNVRSMAFGPDGTLYAVRDRTAALDQLWTIDLVSGSEALVGSLTPVGATAGVQAFAIDGAGVGYMAGPAVPLHLVSLADGLVTPIASPEPGAVSVQSLAFDGGGRLFGMGNPLGTTAASLYRYDLSTGEATELFSTAALDVRGFEWIVPAPGTGAMAVLALACAGRRRR